MQGTVPPTTPTRKNNSIFANSIQKSIQKSKSKQHSSYHNQPNQYFCTLLESIGKKRSFEEENHLNGCKTSSTSSPIRQSGQKKQCLTNTQSSSSVSSSSSNNPPPSPSVRLQDRFIPHRGNVDSEFGYFALEKKNDNIENEEDNEEKQQQEQLMTPGQRKLKEQINQLKSGGKDGRSNSKRIIDCRVSLTPQFDRAGHLTDHIKVIYTALPLSFSQLTACSSFSFPLVASKRCCRGIINT
jgi:hypothetical protein